MASEPTLEAVQAIILRVARKPPDGAGPETALTDGGFSLDSVDLLRAIIECEETFQVAFDPDEDFTDHSLRTVQTLFELIRSKQVG